MVNINEVCDYLITRFSQSEDYLNNLKLQKLLYYVQAWYIVFYNKPLFEGKFQAWVHGPVNRTIYDRFSNTKNLYSQINMSDVANLDVEKNLNLDIKAHIDATLGVYGSYEDYQLEQMTHAEEPWTQAREGFRSSQRCEREIDENIIKSYYSSRI